MLRMGQWSCKRQKSLDGSIVEINLEYIKKDLMFTCFSIIDDVRRCPKVMRR